MPRKVAPNNSVILPPLEHDAPVVSVTSTAKVVKKAPAKKVAAKKASVTFGTTAKMTTLEFMDEAFKAQPIIMTADPELEKLLQEEEAIEKAQAAKKAAAKKQAVKKVGAKQIAAKKIYHCTNCGLETGKGAPGCKSCFSLTPGWCDSKYAPADHALCAGQATGRSPGSCPCSCHVETTVAAAEIPVPSLVFQDSAGWYKTDQNECPACSNEQDPFAPPVSLVEYNNSGKWYWVCCYNICKEGNTVHLINIDEDDQCDLCYRCLDHCTHSKCAACESFAEADSICSHCEYCGYCCDCPSCDHCGSKDKGNCDECEKCYTCCVCSICNNCDVKTGTDYLCSTCGMCEDCGCSDSCGENGTEYDGAHTVEIVGWERRGITITVQYTEPSLVDFSKIDPPTAMAEFYLLSYMMNVGTWRNIDDPTIKALQTVADSARKMRESMVIELDRTFLSYVSMAIGGEVRHHPSLSRNLLSHSREKAWGQWPSIVKQIGPEAFKDASELFRDMDGGYGGEKWAAASDLIYMRLSGKIEPWVFVDHVFSLQHNNGSLLNKTPWNTKGGRIETVLDNCIQIGRAHAKEDPDLTFLLVFVGSEVEALFGDWWVARNRVMISHGQRPERRPFLYEKYTTKYKYGAWTLEVNPTKNDAEYIYATLLRAPSPIEYPWDRRDREQREAQRLAQEGHEAARIKREYLQAGYSMLDIKSIFPDYWVKFWSKDENQLELPTSSDTPVTITDPYYKQHYDWYGNASKTTKITYKPYYYNK